MPSWRIFSSVPVCAAAGVASAHPTHDGARTDSANSDRRSIARHCMFFAGRRQGSTRGPCPGAMLAERVHPFLLTGELAVNLIRGLLAACLFLDVAAHAQSIDSPVVLVADPQLSAFYTRTVLFARPMTGGRHVGFIVNRPTSTRLGALFPEHAPSQKLVDPQVVPRRTGLGRYAVRGRATRVDPGRPTRIPLATGMYLVSDVATLDGLIEQNRDDARFYVGLVVWEAGELAHELRQGIWYVDAARRRARIRKQTDGLWEELGTAVRPGRCRGALDTALTRGSRSKALGTRTETPPGARTAAARRRRIAGASSQTRRCPAGFTEIGEVSAGAVRHPHR